MLRIPLKVRYAEGREQPVLVSAPDLIAFERHFDKPMGQIGSGRMEYMWWTAHHALKRLGMTQLEFDPWLETVEAISDDDQEDSDLPPLERARPTG